MTMLIFLNDTCFIEGMIHELSLHLGKYYLIMSDIVNCILVPTDLTEHGNAAVETAVSFCKALKAKLIIMHLSLIHI